MKMMVLYYSKSGNTKQMAEVIAKGMERVKDAQVKVCSIEDVDEEWAKESKCIILGSPIYVSNVCASVKTWLDGPCKKYQLAGKLGGAFATMDYLHGGGDLGIRLILDHMMVYGMM
ncbi:MAG: flavodoxin, partial [Lachnospiraceae bacterium]|nr:flavodoxin [Lachnospiraceae bacterium]